MVLPQPPAKPAPAGIARVRQRPIAKDPGRPSPALLMKRPTETALRMHADLSGPQFFDQHLDPIDRELIRDRRCDSFVMLDFSIELDALVAHRGSSASRGDQPKRSRFVRTHRHCQAPPVSRPGFIFRSRSATPNPRAEREPEGSIDSAKGLSLPQIGVRSQLGHPKN
jgi:hypothetical protein